MLDLCVTLDGLLKKVVVVYTCRMERCAIAVHLLPRFLASRGVVSRDPAGLAAGLCATKKRGQVLGQGPKGTYFVSTGASIKAVITPNLLRYTLRTCCLVHRATYKPEKPITRIQLTSYILSQHMDSSLHEVWQAASGHPFLPTVGKHSQFLVGFILLFVGLTLGGYFTLSKSIAFALPRERLQANILLQTVLSSTSPFSESRRHWHLRTSLTPLPAPGRFVLTPVLSFGVVYMFCAVGVYV